MKTESDMFRVARTNRIAEEEIRITMETERDRTSTSTRREETRKVRKCEKN